MSALLLLALSSPLAHAEPVVAPFLQDATPTSVWVVWEDDDPGQASVSFGPSEEALTTVTGTSRDTGAGTRIHEAQLTGLQPATAYVYRVHTGEADGELLDLRTPRDTSEGPPLTLLAMSDMQQAAATPWVFEQVVQEGALAWAAEEWGDDIASAFAAVLIPGDLVDEGPNKEEWEETFFGPLAPISARVPVYPVLGNHERDTTWYFDYFHLPDDAPGELKERAWSKRLGNVLLVGLDTNHAVSWGDQLAFLQSRLDTACEDDGVDFVITQVHHPWESEVWIPGNNPLTGLMVEKLEAFTSACDRPSLHLFGHTHAYSRGQLRDHAHLMVNVASAGGALDRWGEQRQQDYERFTVSEDDWGFVVLDVTSGEDAAVRVRRYSRGDRLSPLDNELLDDITIRRHDTPPDTPTGLAPFGDVPSTCVAFQATPFSDPDGDVHQATQWQVAPGGDFTAPTLDVWRQDENRYFGVDTREGASLTEDLFDMLAPGDWSWRVRYRDSGLAWSDWSEPTPFTITARTHGPELLPRQGEHTDERAWALDGAELTGDARCDTRLPREGSHGLALGGACTGAEGGTATLDLDLSSSTDGIAEGWVLHARALSVGGPAQGEVAFRGTGVEVLATETLSLPAAETWTETTATLDVPEGARFATWTWTASTPVELDGLSLVLGVDAPPDCAARARDLPEDPPADAATSACGGCATGVGGGGWWALGLLALGLLRRR